EPTSGMFGAIRQLHQPATETLVEFRDAESPQSQCSIHDPGPTVRNAKIGEVWISSYRLARVEPVPDLTCGVTCAGQQPGRIQPCIRRKDVREHRESEHL